MAERKDALAKAVGDRIFWNISYKHRKVLIPVLLILIFLSAIVLIQSYVSMESRLRQLSSFEPVYVLAINKDLSVGDVITKEDIFARLYYKTEFDKDKVVDEATKLPAPILIPCSYDSHTQELTGFNDVVGRVVKVPVFKGSILRRDFFAEKDAVPGITSFIPSGHSLLDVTVIQSGYNIFIKPGDVVDLYNVGREGSSLIAKNVEVVFVDSLPLGKAPFQVQVNPAQRRNLTLAVKDGIYSTVLQAQKGNDLSVTYNHSQAEEAPRVFQTTVRPAAPSPMSFFQNLLFIKGTDKEVLGR